jgi:hypothetical protein
MKRISSGSLLDPVEDSPGSTTESAVEFGSRRAEEPTMSGAVEREENELRTAFKRVADLRRVADELPEDSGDRHTLRDIADGILRDVRPVRTRVAGNLLGMTEKTVRAWAEEGVIPVVERKPILRLDPGRLEAVVKLVADLREAGRDRNLLDAVWYRLEDAVTLADPDLVTALEQMRNGEGVRWIRYTDGTWGPEEEAHVHDH